MNANERTPSPDTHLPTLYDRVRADNEVRELVELADAAMAAIGYTEHGVRHVSIVAESAGKILAELGYPEEEAELARIAGFLHDVGNVVSRENHERTGALLAYGILRRLGFDTRQIGVVMGAIGNHEEEHYPSISAVGAALTIADKADVHRSRVRDYDPELGDIHDDVNYACVEAQLNVDREQSVITLDLTVDTAIASVMEYFQIFTSRMMMSREAANYLGCDFHLIINGTKLT